MEARAIGLSAACNKCADLIRDAGHKNHTCLYFIFPSLLNIKRKFADQNMEVSGAWVVALTKEAAFTLLRLLARIASVV
jgi:hypothetical protein